MKILFGSVLLLTFGLCCFAQGPSASPEASGLTVIAKKWHSELRNPALEGPFEQDADNGLEQRRRVPDIERTNDKLRVPVMPAQDASSPEIEAPTSRNGASASYIYEVKLRNENKKDIAAVTWEYVFADLDTAREVGRRRFESRTPIGAGKTRNLTGRSAIPPTGTLDAASPSKKKSSTPDHYSEKIVIVTIEYTDGSKWSPAGN